MNSLPFHLHMLDIVFLVCILASTLLGIVRGGIREVLSLAAWVAGAIVAYYYASAFSPALEAYVKEPDLRNLIMFFIVMTIVVMLGCWFAILISSLFRRSGLNGLDRFLGLLFGIVRGVVVLAVVVWGMEFSDFPQKTWWKEAETVPYLNKVVVLLKSIAKDFHLPPAETAKFSEVLGKMPEKASEQTSAKTTEAPVAEGKPAGNK